MAYYTQYETNLIGPLTLASDGEALIGCWFDNDRYFEYGDEAIEHLKARDAKLAQAIDALSSLDGIGIWTAEMLLLFNLGRPDILSFGDLAIHRGMRMVYHHRKVTREMFERYRRRYSPYGSVASLYLWAISHMDVPGYDRDYAPMTDAQKRAARKKRAAEKHKAK